MGDAFEWTDDENNIFFAPDDRTFNGEVDWGFNMTVDEAADCRGIKTSGFLFAHSGAEVGVAELVFTYADDQITAAGVGKGEQVTDKFCFSCFCQHLREQNFHHPHSPQ